MGMTQELFALVTGLAHYLKILTRIALTRVLKLWSEGWWESGSGVAGCHCWHRAKR